MSQKLQFIFIKVLHSINVRPIFALSKAERETHLKALIHKFSQLFCRKALYKDNTQG